jgi:hypothetical protein
MISPDCPKPANHRKRRPQVGHSHERTPSRISTPPCMLTKTSSCPHRGHRQGPLIAPATASAAAPPPRPTSAAGAWVRRRGLRRCSRSCRANCDRCSRRRLGPAADVADREPARDRSAARETFRGNPRRRYGARPPSTAARRQQRRTTRCGTRVVGISPLHWPTCPATPRRPALDDPTRPSTPRRRSAPGAAARR